MSASEVGAAAPANGDLPFGFDPLSRVFRADPWRTYEHMRREDPVHRSPLGMWVTDDSFLNHALESLPVRVRGSGRDAAP